MTVTPTSPQERHAALVEERNRIGQGDTKMQPVHASDRDLLRGAERLFRQLEKELRAADWPDAQVRVERVMAGDGSVPYAWFVEIETADGTVHLCKAQFSVKPPMRYPYQDSCAFWAGYGTLTLTGARARPAALTVDRVRGPRPLRSRIRYQLGAVTNDRERLQLRAALAALLAPPTPTTIAEVEEQVEAARREAIATHEKIYRHEWEITRACGISDRDARATLEQLQALPALFRTGQLSHQTLDYLLNLRANMAGDTDVQQLAMLFELTGDPAYVTRAEALLDIGEAVTRWRAAKAEEFLRSHADTINQNAAFHRGLSRVEADIWRRSIVQSVAHRGLDHNGMTPAEYCATVIADAAALTPRPTLAEIAEAGYLTQGGGMQAGGEGFRRTVQGWVARHAHQMVRELAENGQLELLRAALIATNCYGDPTANERIARLDSGELELLADGLRDDALHTEQIIRELADKQGIASLAEERDKVRADRAREAERQRRTARDVPLEFGW